ncbi:MAG: NAD-dependent epimerase/dehydratase family protein [candidate division WOR-3 bacterium]
MRVLVTGANGFVGSHLCEFLQRSGFSVRAMVRTTSNLQWIAGLGLEFAYADLSDPPSLWVAVQGCENVFHLGAVVRARDRSEFERVNTAGTKSLVDACARAGVRRFLMFSSMAAAGPAPAPDQPSAETQECNPVSDYGLAKLKAEQAVLEASDRLHSVIIRFPAIYGPRDRDGLLLWRWAMKGVMPLLGRTFSVIYVADAVRAAVLAAEKDVKSGSVYHVSDGRCYTWEELAGIVERLSGRRLTKVRIPGWLLPLAASCGELFGSGDSIFNSDKARELMQPCWACSIDRARAELGFEPEYDLAAGLALTFDWYRRTGWL